jgi:hypothetical protein
MKKLVKTAKLLAVVAVVALVAVLVSSVRHPVYSQTTCEPSNLTRVCEVDLPCGGDVVQNPDCNQNECVDPQTEDCAEGCARNNDGICVPEESTTPDDPQDPPAQVLGESTVQAENTGK